MTLSLAYEKPSLQPSVQISRREFLNGATDLTTPAVRDHTDLFFSFMQNAHNLSMVILKRLSSEMGLKGSDRFEAYHKEPGPSLSTLGFLRYPKLDDAASNNLGHNKHTDVGSLTVLLADKWGLQVLSPDTESWAFVEPRPKHAVINVGDSLRFPSRGELSSAVHRVIPRNGKQDEDRYSIAYFLRVNDDATFSDGNGKTWTGKEWHDYKFNAFKFDPKREPSVLEKVVTGMMEENDQLIRRAAKTEMVA
jgi:isopenicillin N synthase-like dioxygenase